MLQGITKTKLKQKYKLENSIGIEKGSIGQANLIYRESITARKKTETA